MKLPMFIRQNRKPKKTTSEHSLLILPQVSNQGRELRDVSERPVTDGFYSIGLCPKFETNKLKWAHKNT